MENFGLPKGEDGRREWHYQQPDHFGEEEETSSSASVHSLTNQQITNESRRKQKKPKRQQRRGAGEQKASVQNGEPTAILDHYQEDNDEMDIGRQQHHAGE